MRSQRRWRCVWGLLALGCLGDAAFALPHWKPKPAGPTTVYAPRVRHYIVVDPVPAPAAALAPMPVMPAAVVGPPASDKPCPPGAAAPAPLPPPDAALVPAGALPPLGPRKGERVKKALSPAQTQTIFWQQRVEPVPAYPWGWFGARRHTSNSGHRRYYDGQYDWELLRGD